MLSPFIRDLSYSSMYSNLMKRTDNIMEFEMEVEGKGVLSLKGPLDDKDVIWSNYRYTTLIDVMKQVSESYKKFVE